MSAAWHNANLMVFYIYISMPEWWIWRYEGHGCFYLCHISDFSWTESFYYCMILIWDSRWYLALCDTVNVLVVHLTPDCLWQTCFKEKPPFQDELHCVWRNVYGCGTCLEAWGWHMWTCKINWTAGKKWANILNEHWLNIQ